MTQSFVCPVIFSATTQAQLEHILLGRADSVLSQEALAEINAAHKAYQCLIDSKLISSAILQIWKRSG